MSHDDILSKVAALVAEELECEAGDLGEDTEFKSLGADSFDLLELVTAFEDEFGLTLEDDALKSIATIGDAVKAIESAQA